jgi:hypothetical protein
MFFQLSLRKDNDSPLSFFPTPSEIPKGDLIKGKRRQTMERFMKYRVIIKTMLFSFGLVLSLFAQSGQTAAASIPSKGEGYKQASAKDIILYWKADSAANSLSIIVNAPTSGWVAVGLDPVGKMKGANVIIGYVKDGKTVIEDQFFSGIFEHKPDTLLGGKSNVTNAEGAEKDGRTELRFTIPLHSGDPYDRNLIVGKEYPLNLAFGKNGEDNTSSSHKKAVRIRITI